MQRLVSLVVMTIGMVACTNPNYPISGNIAMPTLSDAAPYALSPAEKADIESRVIAKLKDPNSAKFGPLIAGKDKDGSLVACGTVNAKNSFGGYTGMMPYQVKMSANEAPVIAIANNQMAFWMQNNCRSRGLAID